MQLALSVIVPAYNAEATIAHCIDSLLSQTLQQLEVIVVDDGSTDGTYAKLCTYTDARLRIFHTENHGQGEARNYGLSHASGTYIGFVDADDTVSPEMYASMIACAEQSGAQVVQCNLSNLFPDGRVTTQLPPMEGTVQLTDPAAYVNRYVYPCIHSFEVCNKLFRRDFITECKLRFEPNSKVFSEDLLWNLQLLPKLTCIHFCKEAWYQYYQSERSHSASRPIERLTGIDTLFRVYLESVPAGEYRTAICRLAALILLQYIARCPDKILREHIVSSPAMREYLHASHLLAPSRAHRALMLALLTLPNRLRMPLIVHHYRVMR